MNRLFANRVVQSSWFRLAAPAVGVAMILGGTVLVATTVGGDQPDVTPTPTVSLPPIGGIGVTEVDVGGTPLAISVGEGRVWVLREDPDGYAVVGVDPVTNEPVGEPLVLPAATSPTSLAAGLGSLWTVSGPTGDEPSPTTTGAVEGGDSVVRVDLLTGVTLATIPVGIDARDVVVAFDSVWVANEADDTVMRIDPATNEVVATVTVGSGPFAIHSGPSGVWVSCGTGDRSSVRIDPATNEVTATFPDTTVETVGPRFVWATGPGGILRIDPDTNAEVPGAYAVASTPAPVAIVDGEIWVGVVSVLGAAGGASPSTAAVQTVFEIFRLDPSTMTAMTESVTVDYRAAEIEAAGQGLWLISDAAGGLLRVDPSDVPRLSPTSPSPTPTPSVSASPSVSPTATST